MNEVVVRTGMRRPSWNKSQAIQQVISLKTLLETTTSDSDKKLYIPRPRFDNVNKNDNPPLNSVRFFLHFPFFFFLSLLSLSLLFVLFYHFEAY